MGTIVGTLPSGVSLYVSVLDSQDKEVSFAEAAKKDYDVIDRFCDAFFYCCTDDPERLSVRAREFPCLIVDDPERFTVWRYDIGEPVIRVNGRTLEGAILRVDSGDKLCL